MDKPKSIVVAIVKYENPASPRKSPWVGELVRHLHKNTKSHRHIRLHVATVEKADIDELRRLAKRHEAARLVVVFLSQKHFEAQAIATAHASPTWIVALFTGFDVHSDAYPTNLKLYTKGDAPEAARTLLAQAAYHLSVDRKAAQRPPT
jgi:hypothetical protein